MSDVGSDTEPEQRRAVNTSRLPRRGSAPQPRGVACTRARAGRADSRPALPRGVPPFRADPDPTTGWELAGWLGGLGLWLVPVADARSFAWAGPWIGRVTAAAGTDRLAVVVFGVPSGVLWDPSGVTETEGWRPVDEFVVSTLDIAGARPTQREAPLTTGTVEELWIAADAGAPAAAHIEIEATPAGLEGDRHVRGTGAFPLGSPW